MSIIDGQPTSAYVVATRRSTVLAVHANVFWSKIATNPQAVRNLSRVLAERMRKRNEATLRALEKEMRLEQLQKELLAAYEIQIGMLPRGAALLPEQPQLDVNARMDVVKSVGGDFYDALRIDDRFVFVAIGDVSGKGMPAALFMVRAVTLLRAELMKSVELDEIVGRFNRLLCETNITHMFVSLLLLRIDLETGAVEYVNAGHLPMLISAPDGKFNAVDESRGLIAGVLEDSRYDVARVELAPGDQLLLYTDGITETRNQARQFYGQARLTEFVSRERRPAAAEFVAGVFDDIASFANGAAPIDDVTVVGLTYRGRTE